jgi:hypothetical protein
MTFVALSFTTIYLLTGIIYFGNKKPNYNHLEHTISELGEKGSTYERKVSLGLFLVVGILLFIVSAYLYSTSSVILIKQYSYLITCVAVGYSVAGFFPCDVGSPINGSARQTIHNMGGFIEYAGGGYFILLIARGTENTILLNVAYLLFTCAILMSLHFLSRWRGLIQRIAEISLFGVMLWLGFFADVLRSYYS